MPSPAPPPLPSLFVDPPLANLVRTAVTTALAKSPLVLVPTLVKLQRANNTEILSMSEKQTGVQTLLHAAAVVLQRRQNQRLRAAGMLSKMGDGSSDKKTTEQVILLQS
jgi:hypothetical protein